MSLKNETAEWDGKSAEGIKAIFSKYHRGDQFADNLIEMLEFPAAQKGASWMLKAFLEDDGWLTAGQTEKLFLTLSNLDHWETDLHILQSLPFLDFGDSTKKELEAFLRQNLKAKNKFVRAWAYNGFYLLGQAFPEFAEEAEALLIDAMATEAPSVKARIRNIKK